MRVLHERTATPKEISVEIDESLNNVAYHIKVLRELGCIELIRVEPAGGGRVAQHVYRAKQEPYFDNEAWEQLGDTDKLNVILAIMQQVSEDIADAMSHGTFCDPDDGHLSRSPMLVDMEGWGELNEVLDDTLGRVLAVKGNVAKRCAGTDISTFPVKVHMINFRSPDSRREG